jgi:hypothetical protein
MRRLIGLTGKARAGKDSAGAVFKNMAYTTDSFAGPIREMVGGIVGMTPVELDRRKEQVVPWLGKSPRQMMQTLGTEWGREMVHTDLWLRRAQAAWARNGDDDFLTEGLVITDVRFQNEADWIRSVGTLIHIHRPGVEAVAPHASEAGIPVAGADLIIHNDGSLEDLTAKVRLIECMCRTS